MDKKIVGLSVIAGLATLAMTAPGVLAKDANILPVEEENVAVFKITQQEYLPAAHAFGTRMHVASNGTGSLTCFAEVDGDFDLEDSYCVGVESGVQAPLEELDVEPLDGFYYASLTGLNSDEEVKVIVSSPNGYEYQAKPTLNPEGRVNPQGTPAQTIRFTRTMLLPEGSKETLREEPELTLTLVDVLCDGDDFCVWPDIYQPMPFPVPPGDEATVCDSDGNCHKGVNQTGGSIWRPPAPYDGLVAIVELEGENAVRTVMLEGDTLEFEDVEVKLEDFLTRRPLDTYLGLPDSERWIPGFYIDGDDQYLVGFYERRVTKGNNHVVTLSGEKVKMPVSWYPKGDVYWSSAARNGKCIKIPVDLSQTKTALDAKGMAEYQPCLDFDYDPDLPLDLHFGMSKNMEPGIYIADRVYLVDFYDSWEVRNGVTKVKLESGVRFRMPDYWFQTDKWWESAAERGRALVVPVNLEKSNAEGRFWAWPDIHHVQAR